MNSRLLDHLVRGLIRDMHEFQPRNIDYWRFPAPRSQRVIQRIKDEVKSLAAKGGFVSRNFSVDDVSDRFLAVLKKIDQLESVYTLLQDEASKEIFVELLRFRILGHRHTKLRLNEEQFWKARSVIKSKSSEDPSNPTNGSWAISRFKLDPPYDGIELEAHPLGLLNVFVLEQYAYKKGPALIEVEPGDIVIDGGGCFGDTALYFAHKAGDTGKVFSFEFVPENLQVFKRNLALNEQLARTINILEKPLWEKSGEILRFNSAGPSTRLAREADKQTLDVQTISIDNLVTQEALPSVGFIKMDIEGAELAALRGAEETICKFKPKLAISVYHHENDLLTISRYLHQLNLGYNFFLDQFTIYGEETVLFARCN